LSQFESGHLQKDALYPVQSVGSLLHVVPTLPPAINGLAGYFQNLWNNWSPPRPRWSVLALDLPNGGESLLSELQQRKIQPNESDFALGLSALGGQTVVLHYVPFAYDPKGGPAWIHRGLMDWKRSTGGKLVVMFHELFAITNPWRKTFWRSPRSIACFSRTAKLADCWITSNEKYYGQIRIITRGRVGEGVVIPVGSNIEVASQPEKSYSALTVGIFGLPATRVAAVEAHRDLIVSTVRNEPTSRVLAMGQPSAHNDDRIRKIAAIDGWESQLTFASGSDRVISEALSECHFGLVATNIDYLGKSGVCAALAVHGAVPVAVGRSNTQVKHPVLTSPSPGGGAVTPLLTLDAYFGMKERLSEWAFSELSWTSIAKSWNNHLLKHVGSARETS